jgi:nicotinamidase-related amidase
MSFHNVKWTTHPTRALLVCIASEPALLRRTWNSRQPSELEANGMTLVESWERAQLPLVFIEHYQHESAPIYDEWRSSSRPPRSFTAPAPLGAAFDAEVETQDFSNPRVRPRPGDLVFQTPKRSLFRNSRFIRFFEDLGGPLLILVGDDLDGFVMETAIDSLLSGYPLIVVTDAAPLGSSNLERSAITRPNAISLLSCFARLMKTSQLLNEWAIS